MTGDDRVATARAFSHCPLSKVEPQPGLAHFWIGAVATETTTGQDGLHILIEIEASRNLGAVATDDYADGEGRDQQTKADA